MDKYSYNNFKVMKGNIFNKKTSEYIGNEVTLYYWFEEGNTYAAHDDIDSYEVHYDDGKIIKLSDLVSKKRIIMYINADRHSKDIISVTKFPYYGDTKIKSTMSRMINKYYDIADPTINDISKLKFRYNVKLIIPGNSLISETNLIHLFLLDSDDTEKLNEINNLKKNVLIDGIKNISDKYISAGLIFNLGSYITRFSGDDNTIGIFRDILNSNDEKLKFVISEKLYSLDRSQAEEIYNKLLNNNKKISRYSELLKEYISSIDMSNWHVDDFKSNLENLRFGYTNDEIIAGMEETDEIL